MAKSFSDICDELYQECSEWLDLELFSAIFVILSAKRHMVVSTQVPMYAERLVQLIYTNIFGVHDITIVKCASDMELQEFVAALFPVGCGKVNSSGTTSVTTFSNVSETKVVLIHRLQETSKSIQVFLLDLMVKNKAVFNGVDYYVPKNFNVIAFQDSSRSSNFELISFLHENFFLYNQFNVDQSIDSNHNIDNLDFLSDENQKLFIDQLPSLNLREMIGGEVIEDALKRVESQVVQTEMRRYMQDIAVCVRVHRAVGNGFSARSMIDFDLMVRYLCYFNDRSYVTPMIITMAAKKVIPCKIIMRKVEMEPMFMMGSEYNYIKACFNQWGPELIVEDILKRLPSPL